MFSIHVNVSATYNGLLTTFKLGMGVYTIKRELGSGCHIFSNIRNNIDQPLFTEVTKK